MQQILSKSDLRARTEKAGAIPIGSTSAQVKTQMQTELALMRKLIETRRSTLED
jgi:hypothetical protein